MCSGWLYKTFNLRCGLLIAHEYHIFLSSAPDNSRSRFPNEHLKNWEDRLGRLGRVHSQCLQPSRKFSTRHLMHMQQALIGACRGMALIGNIPIQLKSEDKCGLIETWLTRPVATVLIRKPQSVLIAYVSACHMFIVLFQEHMYVQRRVVWLQDYTKCGALTCKSRTLQRVLTVYLYQE